MVKVLPEIAHYFKVKEIFPLQKIAKEWEDGSLTIESQVSNHREAITILRQWIPCITILEPKELKEEIKITLKKALEKV